MSSRKSLSVAIIGGGFGGIATAVMLKRAGFEDFTVFEQLDGPGGTWRRNTYPGCEVDLHVHLYSFSFTTFDWTSTHAQQPELLRYAEHVVDEAGIRPHFRYSTCVESVIWNEDSETYTVRTADGDQRDFNVVVSCMGFLDDPKYPEWPGLDTFEGTSFHTQHWNHDHDLTGKRVAIVGTGSTACQVVPAIAPDVEHLYVFQRQPGWVMPKGERPFTEQERARHRKRPMLQTIEHYKLMLKSSFSRLVTAYDANSDAQKELRAMCEKFIESQIADPGLRNAVTPDFPWGCKRPVFATTYYAALTRDNVTLVPHSVTEANTSGVVDDEGVGYDVDTLIFSTGFKTTEYLAGLDVIGPGGVRLHDAWRDRPQAFLGINVAGFPNFFILYGPNTNGGSIINQLECQAKVLVGALKRMRRSGARTVGVSRSTMERYVRWIDKQLAAHYSATDRSNCHNYYYTSAGRNVTQWPGTMLKYYVLTRILPRLALRFGKSVCTPVGDELTVKG
jgi:cation diffusion facilitator CzcD-associated flavoprotein CzcO